MIPPGARYSIERSVRIKAAQIRMRFLHAFGFTVGRRTGHRETLLQKNVHEHNTHSLRTLTADTRYSCSLQTLTAAAHYRRSPQFLTTDAHYSCSLQTLTPAAHSSSSLQTLAAAADYLLR